MNMNLHGNLCGRTAWVLSWVLCIFLLSAGANAEADDNGKYWYLWGTEIHVYETLEAAEQSLKSQRAPASMASQIGHELGDGYEVLYHYAAPEKVDWTDKVTLYDSGFSGPSCSIEFCWSLDDVVQRMLHTVEASWGFCVIDYKITGEWGAGGYGNGGKPYINGRIHGFYRTRIGKNLEFTAQLKAATGACFGYEMHYVRQISIIDFYYCPDGYRGTFSEDHRQGWCGTNWHHSIHSPLDQNCDGSAAGDGCGSLSGSSVVHEKDSLANDLEFERIYHSSGLK